MAQNETQARFDSLSTCFSRLEMSPPSWEALRLAMATGAELAARECQFGPGLEIRRCFRGDFVATLRRLDFSAEERRFPADAGFVAGAQEFVAKFLGSPPREN